MALRANPPCMKRRQTLGGIFSLIVETRLRGLGKVLNYGCRCMKSWSCGNWCICVPSCTLIYVHASDSKHIYFARKLEMHIRASLSLWRSVPQLLLWSGAKQLLKEAAHLSVCAAKNRHSWSVFLWVMINCSGYFQLYPELMWHGRRFHNGCHCVISAEGTESTDILKKNLFMWLRWHPNTCKNDLQASIQYPDCGTL